MNLILLILSAVAFLLLIRKLLRKFLNISVRHEAIAEKTATAVEATRVVSFLVGIGAWLSAPTGLGAIGVALGIVSPSLFTKILPILMSIGVGATALNSAVQLYSRSMKKREARRARAAKTTLVDGET